MNRYIFAQPYCFKLKNNDNIHKSEAQEIRWIRPTLTKMERLHIKYYKTSYKNKISDLLPHLEAEKKNTLYGHNYVFGLEHGDALFIFLNIFKLKYTRYGRNFRDATL